MKRTESGLPLVTIEELINRFDELLDLVFTQKIAFSILDETGKEVAILCPITEQGGKRE